jgi:hypothetical protein
MKNMLESNAEGGGMSMRVPDWERLVYRDIHGNVIQVLALPLDRVFRIYGFEHFPYEIPKTIELPIWTYRISYKNNIELVLHQQIIERATRAIGVFSVYRTYGITHGSNNIDVDSMRMGFFKYTCSVGHEYIRPIFRDIQGWLAGQIRNLYGCSVHAIGGAQNNVIPAEHFTEAPGEVVIPVTQTHAYDEEDILAAILRQVEAQGVAIDLVNTGLENMLNDTSPANRERPVPLTQQQALELLGIDPATLGAGTPARNYRAESEAMLAQYLAALDGAIPQVMTPEEHRELMERMREYMRHLNQRLREGGLSADLTRRLWDVLNRMRGTFDDVNTQALTPEMVKELTRALERERDVTGALAREAGYVGVGAGVGEGRFNWNRLRLGWAGIGQTFPFSIPFDLINMGRSFDAQGQRPEPISVNILPFIPNNAGMVTLDLFNEDFDNVVRLLRIFLLLLFCVGLAILTGRVIRW